MGSDAIAKDLDRCEDNDDDAPIDSEENIFVYYIFRFLSI